MNSSFNDLLSIPIGDIDDLVHVDYNWNSVSDDDDSDICNKQRYNDAHDYDGRHSFGGGDVKNTTTSCYTNDDHSCLQHHNQQQSHVVGFSVGEYEQNYSSEDDNDENDIVVHAQEQLQHYDQQFYQHHNFLLYQQQQHFLQQSQLQLQEQPQQQKSQQDVNEAIAAANGWGEWDVPLGRAQEVRVHIGNVRFRHLVETHRPAYLEAERRSEKSFITNKVYTTVTENGGRFLDKGAKENEWQEISQDKALAKVSQALRTGTRPVKKSSKAAAQQQQQKSKDNHNNDNKNDKKAVWIGDSSNRGTTPDPSLPSFAREITSDMRKSI